MTVYLRWNDAIAAHFFNDGNAGRPVYLYLNEALIERIGQTIGHDLTNFLWAVGVSGPSWARREGLCQRALEALKNWRARNLPYPPYIAYLGLFVLAAGLDGDFAPQAYYPRLRKLLSLPGERELASFHRMLELWDDLERWSSHDTQGRLGVFQARIAGSFIHVGLPIAQRVLTDADRKSLPILFGRAGLDPTSMPSDRELSRILRVNAPSLLEARTAELLRHGDASLIAFIVDIARDELLNWDGTVPTAEGAPPMVRGSLRLLLTIDHVARRAHFQLRCRLNREFPAAALELTDSGGRLYRCIEAQAGWSSPVSFDGGRVADGAQFNWAQPLKLVDPSGWEFVLPAADVRIFVDGRPDNLMWDVEVHELPRAIPFRIAFHARAWPQLAAWVSHGCVAFELVDVTGLPDGWRLAKVAQATTDDGLRDAYPRLAFSSTVRVRLVGGVRAGTGNNYFSYALPRLIVEAAEPDDEVRAQGQLLNERDDDGRYVLPPTLPEGDRILIEVERSGTVVRRQSIFIAATEDWRIPPSTITSDRLGRPVDARAAARFVVGADATPSADAPTFKPYPFLLREARARANRDLYLLGPHPGQLVDWPTDELPEDWVPVWAIRKTKGKEPLFCGRGIEDSAPNPTPSGIDVLRWKRLLWTERDRVREPADPVVRELWKRYQAVARDV